MSLGFRFVIPAIVFPCGFETVLPMDSLAVLRGAGVERLRFAKCWECGEEHIADLPEVQTVDTLVISDLSIATPNGHH